ncbi:hypothetical protein GCM10009616_06010 [Microlunatus lacustris]
MLTLVRDAFAELSGALSAAATDPDPVVRLRAVGAAHLEFAGTRPSRYRVVFARVWSAARALDSAAITEADAASLGQDVLALLTATLRACVDAGRSTSSDPFSWPDDIVERLVDPLAHLR